MRNLLYRFITSLILLPVVITVFVVGGYILSLFLALVCVLACLEVAQMIDPENRQTKIFTMLFACGMFVPVFLSQSIVPLILCAFIIFFVTNSTILFLSTISRNQLEKLASIFYWSAYVIFGVSCLHWLISSPPGMDVRVGLSFALLACLATWGNDTFAYFGGRLFGKHPLFKSVSAKKTWEGFFCGAVLSVLSVLLIDYLTTELALRVFYGLTLGDLLWILVPATILAPIGDLIESRLKRIYDIKDSSNILPGHGGLLDRIDGLLLVFPWTALYAFFIRPLC